MEFEPGEGLGHYWFQDGGGYGEGMQKSSGTKRGSQLTTGKRMGTSVLQLQGNECDQQPEKTWK